MIDLPTLARSLCGMRTYGEGLEHLHVDTTCPNCARIEAALRDVRREAFKEAAKVVRQGVSLASRKELQMIGVSYTEQTAAALERLGEG